MISYYIFKNKDINPNILLLSTIDNSEEIDIDEINNNIISTLLENEFINLNSNVIFCILDNKTNKKNFFVYQGIDANKININQHFLTIFSLKIISTYNSDFFIDYNMDDSEIRLHETKENLSFLANYW